jgi:hypothetical protein
MDKIIELLLNDAGQLSADFTKTIAELKSTDTGKVKAQTIASVLIDLLSIAIKV